jgi:hypothetical protein
MEMPSNGWTTLIRPDDGVTGINALHRRSDGIVTIWHQIADGYRLTAVSPNGSIQQTTGRTKAACRARIR